MKRHLWKIKKTAPQAYALAKKHNIPVLLAQVFINRGIKEDSFFSFLNPSSLDSHSPSLLPDIEKATARIHKAIKFKEKVLVFGDYDVDGITSLVIFNEFARNYKNMFSFYIPHRVDEGYGLNKEVIAKAEKEGVSLIIAFDCGTNAYEEIELARSLNIEVIVIDHHLPKEGLTDSFAFINPRRKDSLYPFPDLSAAALSYKFLQVLTNSDCHEVLDLVALSLVCDVASLTGENRALLKEGVKVIKQGRRIAIKALCKVSGIRPENIDIFHIGYILGPRINAAGRVAHANLSLELFLTEDEDKIYDIALDLDKYNKLRKKIESNILKEAEQKIEDTPNNEQVIVVSGEGWHIGVLGIVASRLAGKYYRPSFVISFDQDKGVGSARSVEGVHLIEILDKCADSLLVYGGHKRAAGMRVSKNELNAFREKIGLIMEDNYCPQDFVPAIDIDGVLTFKDINTNFVESLETMKPYGEGNPKPVFVAYDIIKKTRPQKVKSDFSLWLSNEGKVFEGIIRDKDILEIINYSDKLDMVFSLENNNYHNTSRLIIRDCRIS